MNMKTVGSNYLENLFRPPGYAKLIITATIQFMNTQFPKDTGLIVTGLSGSLLGYAIMLLGGIPVAFVRKDDEHSHGERIEGILAKKVVFFDDFIARGTTFLNIQTAIQKHNHILSSKVKFAGSFFWSYFDVMCKEEVAKNGPVFRLQVARSPGSSYIQRWNDHDSRWKLLEKYKLGSYDDPSWKQPPKEINLSGDAV